MAQTLPPFPVDDETLNVIRDSLDRTVTGWDDDGNPICTGSPFGLGAVLDLLSGYDPTLTVQMVNEYDQPIPDWYEYTGPGIYHAHDVIRALIDEVRYLRTAKSNNPESE